uniref:Uncharacterized protein n=1 Tax=Brassica oleracea var. oleracea TaxID=109376 RepID=A0A0D3BG56_BRAOL
MNLPRNFNGLGEFVRPSPPLLVPKFMLNICQLNHFINLWILQMMYHPHCMPFMEPPHVLFPYQNPDRMPSIKPRLVLLKELTSNIQLILDSLQGSDIVEVQGNEIRNRHLWRKYVMPHDWRVTFYPSQEYAMPANNHQHMHLEQKQEEVRSSSSNQNDDNNNNNLVV